MKALKFIKNYWLILLVFSYLFFNFIKLFIEDKKVEKHGIITNAVVRYYEKISDAKRGTYTISVGFYRVKNKPYRCNYEGIIPIDSTFKVKYYPNNPEIARIVDE